MKKLLSVFIGQHQLKPMNEFNIIKLIKLRIR